jgi:hypothetical protein
VGGVVVGEFPCLHGVPDRAAQGGKDPALAGWPEGPSPLDGVLARGLQHLLDVVTAKVAHPHGSEVGRQGAVDVPGVGVGRGRPQAAARDLHRQPPAQELLDGLLASLAVADEGSGAMRAQDLGAGVGGLLGGGESGLGDLAAIAVRAGGQLDVELESVLATPGAAVPGASASDAGQFGHRSIPLVVG